MIRPALALLALRLSGAALAQGMTERVQLREIEVTVTREGKPLAHEVLRLPVYPDRKDSYGPTVSYERRWNEELTLDCGKQEAWNEVETEIKFHAQDQRGMTQFRMEWSEVVQRNDHKQRCSKPVKEERRVQTIESTMRLEPGVEQRWEGDHGIVAVARVVERAAGGA